MQKQAPNTAVSQNAKPHVYHKRIGSTVFTVTVHFSDTGSETAKDKLLQLMKREVEQSA